MKKKYSGTSLKLTPLQPKVLSNLKGYSLNFELNMGGGRSHEYGTDWLESFA